MATNATRSPRNYQRQPSLRISTVALGGLPLVPGQCLCDLDRFLATEIRLDRDKGAELREKELRYHTLVYDDRPHGADGDQLSRRRALPNSNGLLCHFQREPEGQREVVQRVFQRIAVTDDRATHVDVYLVYAEASGSIGDPNRTSFESS